MLYTTYLDTMLYTTHLDTKYASYLYTRYTTYLNTMLYTTYLDTKYTTYLYTRYITYLETRYTTFTYLYTRYTKYLDTRYTTYPNTRYTTYLDTRHTTHLDTRYTNYLDTRRGGVGENKENIVLELGLQWATKRSSLQKTTQDFRESNTELYRGIHIYSPWIGTTVGNIGTFSRLIIKYLKSILRPGGGQIFFLKI